MGLIDYIKGQRKGKEAHSLEREAMEDPFLADALDGFDSVQGNHVERIEALRKYIAQPTATRDSSRKMLYLGIAASLLICVTVGGYFLLNDKEQESFVAQSELAIENLDEKPQSASPSEPQEEKSLPKNALENQQSTTSKSASDTHSPATPEEAITDNTEDAASAEQIVSTEDAAAPSTKAETAKAEAKFEAKEGSDKAMQSVTMPAGSPITKAAKAVTSNKTPEPVIGMKAYKKYLKDSLVRPKDGDCAKKKGKVLVTFKIDAEGTPVNVSIAKGLCPDSNEEALRLVKEGGKWTGSTSKTVVVEVSF